MGEGRRARPLVPVPDVGGGNAIHRPQDAVAVAIVGEAGGHAAAAEAGQSVLAGVEQNVQTDVGLVCDRAQLLLLRRKGWAPFKIFTDTKVVSDKRRIERPKLMKPLNVRNSKREKITKKMA